MSMKYYLGFLPDLTRNRVGLHCTHAYLGTKSREMISDITDQVDNFFMDKGPIIMPEVVFDNPQMFGVLSDWPVLTTKDHWAFRHFIPIRKYLEMNEMVSTKWPFTPHLSEVYAVSVRVQFRCYALISQGYIIQHWPIYTMEQISNPIPVL